MLRCRLLVFFSKTAFFKNSLRNNIRVSNSLDPNQTRQLVGPDLGPNFLPRLSADGPSSQSFKHGEMQVLKGKQLCYLHS